MGGMTGMAGIVLLMGKNTLAAVIIIFMAVFMMLSKDNIKVESTVPVIGREKPMRLENFCRDASLIGAALIILGGLGGDSFNVHEDKPIENIEET